MEYNEVYLPGRFALHCEPSTILREDAETGSLSLMMRLEQVVLSPANRAHHYEI
jgi:hypothetical protein